MFSASTNSRCEQQPSPGLARRSPAQCCCSDPERVWGCWLLNVWFVSEIYWSLAFIVRYTHVESEVTQWQHLPQTLLSMMLREHIYGAKCGQKQMSPLPLALLPYVFPGCREYMGLTFSFRHWDNTEIEMQCLKDKSFLTMTACISVKYNIWPIKKIQHSWTNIAALFKSKHVLWSEMDKSIIITGDAFLRNQ